jgi:hypothetical protein
LEVVGENGGEFGAWESKREEKWSEFELKMVLARGGRRL